MTGRRTFLVGALTLLGLSLLGAAGAYYFYRPVSEDDPPTLIAASSSPEATTAEVHQFCAACHVYPPPESFRRASWRKEVKQGYDFVRESALQLPLPSLEAVVRYYENRAPVELPVIRRAQAARAPPVQFTKRGHSLPGAPLPAVANVSLAHLSDRRRLDVLACDMRSGKVVALRPYDLSPIWRTLGQVSVPAHAEVVDLDGDGVADILIACLGVFFPTDGRVGSIVWLRGAPDGSFTPVTLLEGVGRVADVRAADFNGDGKLDLVAAVFGWRKTGEILYLENRTEDWSRPVFVPHVVDDRHGSIHVPVCELNGDGRPDFVALISQEHEAVVAFLNEGAGRFRKEPIFTGPHPAFGSSGIELTDLDGDGDPDVLYTNGDALDDYTLKPYHGVGWLENRGRFPFAYHRLADLYGAERAAACDLDGDGLLDIVAVSWLPASGFPQRTELGLDAVLLLHQTRPGVFESYPLETGTCDHPTCAVGDLFGDGQAHLVIGNHYFGGTPPSNAAVTVWRNLPRAKIGGR
jgi:hypothetical protein